MYAPKRLALPLLAVAGLGLSACGSNDATTSAEGGGDNGSACNSVSIQASHHLTADSPVQTSLENLGDEVSASTDGRVTVEVFSDGQLGGLAEMTDNLRSGGIGLALIDGGTLSQFEGQLGVLDLPYLFEDEDQFNSVMDGSFGEAYNDLARKVGVEPVFWSAVGARDMFFTKAEVDSPDDLRGLQMRVPEAPVWINTFEALGASPQAIPSGDLYTALDTGVVDGYELPLGTVVDLNLHEPVNRWSPTGHMMNSLLIAASPTVLEQMCEDDRAAFDAAAESARDVMREEWMSLNGEAETVLTDSLTKTENVDVAAFEEAVQVVHENFKKEHGADLYEQLTAEVGN